MRKSASAPTSVSLSSSDAAFPAFSELTEEERDQLPIGVSRLVASRMRLDATLSPAMLDLRMNTRNLVNEMKYNNGKIVSHQFALMRPRRKQVWEKPEELSKEYVDLKKKALKKQTKLDRNKRKEDEMEAIKAKKDAVVAPTRAAETDDMGVPEDPLDDFSLDLEVSRLLEDPRIESVWRSLQERPATADTAADDGPPKKLGLARSRTVRALEALGHSNPDAKIVEDSLKSLPGNDPLDLNEFISIVAVFNRQRRIQLRERFKTLDTDGSGTVSAGEFRHLLWDLGYSVTPEHVREYLREVDADNSGEVEFAEFEHACQLVHQRHGFTVAEVQEFESLFDRYDTDGSGEMEAAELASAMGWFGSATTMSQAQQIIKRFDDDGSGTISRPEFLMVMRSRLEEEISEMRATFAEFDEDASGTMDVSELTKLFSRNGYSLTEDVIQDSIKVLLPHLARGGASELLFEDVLRLWHFIRKREGFSENERSELVDVFNRHDTGARGELREFELARALNWLGYTLSQQRRRELWCRVDVDKTESIEQGELLKLVRLLREEETKYSEELLKVVEQQTVQKNQRQSHLPEPLLKNMLYKLGYFPPQHIINQALKQSCDASGDGQADLSGILGMLRFIREQQVVKLRQSAGLADQQVNKIRGKFGLRLEAGKHIDPSEFERFMYDLFPAARHAQDQRERIKGMIKQHSKESGIMDLMEAFWIVRLYGDARDEDTWRREQAAAAAAGFHSTQVAQFREAYVAADENGDGCLSEREIQTVFEDLMSLNLGQVETMRREFHNLGDRKECIEFADFLRLMRIVLDEGRGMSIDF